MFKTLAFFATVGFSLIAVAQTPANWVGTYKITWPNERGRTLEAKMVLSESGAGTWQTYTRAGDQNPCVGREVPVQVEQAGEREAKIVLKFAQAIPGCNDVMVHLKAGDNNTITGTRGKAELTVEKR